MKAESKNELQRLVAEGHDSQITKEVIVASLRHQGITTSLSLNFTPNSVGAAFWICLVFPLPSASSRPATYSRSLLSRTTGATATSAGRYSSTGIVVAVVQRVALMPVTIGTTRWPTTLLGRAARLALLQQVRRDVLQRIPGEGRMLGRRGPCRAGLQFQAEGYDNRADGEHEWRFCSKCRVIFHNLGGTKQGVCAAGGGHVAAGNSYRYILDDSERFDY